MRGEMGEDGRGVVMEIVYSEWLIIFEHLEHLERARARCVCEVAEMQSPSRAGQSCGQS